MARLILALMAFAMVMAVLKMVIFAIVIAGLIFRPRETIGLLIVGGVFALFHVSTLLGLAGVALIVVAAILVAAAKSKEAALRLPGDAPP